MCGSSKSTTSVDIPKWIEDPSRDAIGRAEAASQVPFTPYGGTIVPGINATQQAGINAVGGNLGSWEDALAGSDVDMAAARGELFRAGSLPTSMEAGSGYLQRGASMSATGAAQPYVTAGTGAGGLATASPYLRAASTTAPGAIGAYMSPYTSGVVDEIARLGSRNLTENILPNINDTFIGSGQFGSDRNAATIGRAVRDASRDIAGQQAAALESGYRTAGDLFTSDATRMAGLAGTAGSLGESAAGRQLSGAQIMGGFTGDDANRQIQVGREMAALAQADQASALARATQGANLASTGSSLAGQRSALGLADASALLQAGGIERGVSSEQAASDYEQFLRQQGYDKDQLSWLNSIIRGTASPQSQTTTAPSSTFKDLGALGILGAGLFLKDGGSVRHKAQEYVSALGAGRRHMADGGALGGGGAPRNWWERRKYDIDEGMYDLRKGAGKLRARLDDPVAATALAMLASDRPTFGGAAAEGALATLWRRPYRDDDIDPADPMPRRRRRFRDGGPVDEEDDPMAPGGAPTAAAPAVPVPAPALSSAAPAAPMDMAQARERLMAQALDDSAIRTAEKDVSALQSQALAPAPEKAGWFEKALDSPLAIAALGMLASDRPSAIGAAGEGALTALRMRQATRREDRQDDRTRRMDALKAAQQNLSNLISRRQVQATTLNNLMAQDERTQRAKEDREAKADAARIAAQARIDAAREAGASRELIAQMSADARRDVAAILGGSRENVANINADVRRDVAKLGDETKRLAIAAKSGDVQAKLALEREGFDVKKTIAQLDRESRESIATGKNETALAVAQTRTPAGEFALLGLDPMNDGDRALYEKIKGAGKGGSKQFAPHELTKLQAIVDDPAVPEDLREAAKRKIASIGNRDMTDAQKSALRARAAALAQTDMGSVLKDYQFASPEAAAEYRDALTGRYLEWLEGGEQGPAPTAPPPPTAAAPTASTAAEGAPTPAAALPSPKVIERRTVKERDARFEARTAIKAAVGDVDFLLRELEKAGTTGDWKTGIGGALQRGYNSTIGQVAGDLDPKDSDYFARSQSLRAAAQALLKVDNNMSRDERRDLEAFVGNDKWLQSRDTVVANLREVKRILDRRASMILGDDAGATAPGQAPSAAGTRENPATPQTPEDLAAMPAGTYYINPADGRVFRKK